jgi:hypothetical protein
MKEEEEGGDIKDDHSFCRELLVSKREETKGTKKNGKGKQVNKESIS